IKPRNGEKPPFSSSSRSRMCRAVKSHEGKSLDWVFSSAAFSASTMRLTSSPPCGGMRWLRVIEVSKVVNVLGFQVIILQCHLLDKIGRGQGLPWRMKQFELRQSSLRQD